MGKPKAPTPPDPKETSAASTATNVGTAIANTAMQFSDQNTPYGSLTYDQTGTYSWNDPYTGKTYDIPTFTSTVSLSPGEQAILDNDTQARTNLSGIAADQSGFLGDYLAQPFQGDTAAIEDRLGELYSSRMDPQFARDEEALRTRLANQGLTAGSEPWNREMERLGQAKNDARVQTMLQGRGQAFNELSALRNQPINEITALLSGSQVNTPNVSPTSAAGIPTTDVAGLINENYNQKLNNYNTQMSQRNSLMGGLFGLGAKALSGGLF